MPDTQHVRVYTDDLSRLDALRLELQGELRRDMTRADAIHELLEVRRAYDAARGVLRDIEWLPADEDWCPYCKAPEWRGHRDDCKLRAALDAKE